MGIWRCDVHGYAGMLLRVNLSTGKVDREPVAMQDAIDFVGGRGLGIKYLYSELAPNIDPLGEDNKLLLLAGVLAGTPVVAASRWLACTKSPLTGCYARSCAGGDFGAWLKFAGYDFVIIEGKAEKPVYLYITADTCVIEDARVLWGKDTAQTQAWLHQRYGKGSRTACIGPAGENLVKYAAIVTGRRTASRCGVGTVMGSKGLKAVTINAQKTLNLHDASGLRILVKEQIDSIRKSKEYQYHKDVGTTEGAISRGALGVFPVRNFRYGQQRGYEQLSAEAYRAVRVGEFGCYNCPARCGKTHHIHSGPYAGALSEGPEYESLWSFTGSIESNNLEATVAADALCDDLGLDTISTGGCIGFAYELYEKGLLTKDDTDGLELTYGNHAAMVSLIKKIGRREGFGDVLAEGAVRAASRIGRGTAEYAMHVKGLELPGYEPRGLKATGFGYATSNVGGSHGNGSLAFQEWGVPVPRAVDRFSEQGKADIVIYNQNQSALGEVGCVCVFSRGWGDWYRRLFPKMLAAVTGIEQFADWDYLRRVAERIVNMDRAFNARDGFGRAQDTLPKRMLSEPLHTWGAPGEGQMVRELDTFLDEYYRLRGWTSNGIPSREKLTELGLSHVAADLEQAAQKQSHIPGGPLKT